MKPKSLATLVAYLKLYPRVRITGPTPKSREVVTREETFDRFANGCLLFRNEAGEEGHLPIGCHSVSAESGMEFDEGGFTFTKFGVRVRVEYLGDGEGGDHVG